MAQTFTLQPNPHWVIIDNFSKLPNGAAIFTYRSLNKEEFKPAFEDAAGTIPYSQPIVGFQNGTMPPIFWEFDSLNPQETYYIQVFDSADPQTRQFLWDFDGLSGATSGGGGVITTVQNIDNLIANDVFFRHVDDTTPVPKFLTLSPDNNSGFVADFSTASVPTAPDAIFSKSNATSTDSITFPPFISDDIAPVAQTPENYLRYTCSVTGSELFKVIQIPISKGLRNTSGQVISCSLFSRWVNGDNNVTVQLRQFFGSGGPANPDIITPIGTLSYTLGINIWQFFQFTSISIPSITGLTLGTCGNDGLFLQILLPPSLTTTLDFTKPAIFLGTKTNPTEFKTYDQIDSIINLPRTGDIRTSVNAFSPYGWVPANDGTIGNVGSTATTRANRDTFPLYDLIWNAVSQPFAPVTGGRGASSIADFAALKPIALTRNLGRVMAGAVPVVSSQTFVAAGNTLVVSSTSGFYTGMAVTINVTGGGLFAGVIYYAIVLSATTLSLATTTANALAGTVIALGAVPAGTIVSVNVETLGSFIGEETHLLTQAELPATLSTVTMRTTNLSVNPGGTPISGVGPPAGSPPGSTANTDITGFGSGIVHNNMQPTVYMNVFIKL